MPPEDKITAALIVVITAILGAVLYALAIMGWC